MEIKEERIVIGNIPAIIWGNDSNKVFIHVHGKMSKKEYAKQFAIIAETKGYQTISFDLPEHGERVDHSYRCDVWNGQKDLTTIADYAYTKWKTISLFACSLGAYFALNTYTDRVFDQILFQSPIIDMRWLVEHMMLWSCVTEEMLEQKREIDTPIDVLRWDYYQYIKGHPVTNWHEGTQILYGKLDTLQDIECIKDFVKRFHCKLTISENSEHAFMAEQDSKIVNEWLQNSITE